MGRIGVVETASAFSQPQKTESHGEASKLAWGSTALSLASLMLLTDSAEAQQSSGPLPTIQVNPPQRAKQKQATSAARRRGRLPRRRATAPRRANPDRSDRTRHRLSGRPARRLAHPDAADRYAADRQRRHAAGNPRSQHHHRWKTRCAAFPASRSTRAKADSRATPRSSAASSRAATSSATASAIRAGTRAILFSVERVEVYKGPSAFAFGRGSTGGAINTRLEAADRPDLS